jgi:hypothetical protein
MQLYTLNGQKYLGKQGLAILAHLGPVLLDQKKGLTRGQPFGVLGEDAC